MNIEGAFAEFVAERAPIGLLILDADGVIQWTSQYYADLLDIPRETLEGMAFMTLVERGIYKEEITEKYQRAVRNLLTDSTDTDTESYIATTYLPNGEQLYHDVSTRLLPLTDGEFSGTFHAFRDVTNEYTIREDLNRQNERLESFASVVSHDLRNPLNIAQGNLNLVEDDLPADRYQTISTALNRIDEITSDLLSLARTGEQVSELTEVDVEQTARNAWSLVADTDDATLILDGDLPRIRADESRLKQLFENLFSNSIEYGGPTVTVCVGVIQEGFAVSDDGPGIPSDKQDQIFKTGYTTNNAGTGLGLAIVRSIVDGHGWSVEVTESDTGGARFEIRHVDIAACDP